MSLPKSVTMTKDGGHFWKAQLFSVSVTYTVLPVVLLAMLIVFVNPLWFRDWAINKVITGVDRYSRWRNYKMYSIYLGCDPKMWHTLKDDHEVLSK